MHIVVGLWNPESRYEGTRHNLGAEVVQNLADRSSTTLKRGPMRVRAMVGRARLSDEPVILSLPRTSMNLSGPSVVSLLRYFKAEPADLLVLHDDIDVPFGKLKLQTDRGPGGHNGIKSIISALGTREFWRLKMGVGRPPGRMDPAKFVLTRFNSRERPEIDLVIQHAADVTESFVVDREQAIRMAGEWG